MNKETAEVKEVLRDIIDEIISNMEAPSSDDELNQAFIADDSNDEQISPSSSLDSSDIEEFYNITTALLPTPPGYENSTDIHHEYFGDNGYNGHRIIINIEY